MCANCFVFETDGLTIPSINNLKGQIKRLKDALSRSQKSHRMTLQKLHRACEVKRLLSEQVQLMEKKVTTECKLMARVLLAIFAAAYFGFRRWAICKGECSDISTNGTVWTGYCL